ncbi:deaminase [Actinomadura craniellae]|uniref:Deaminase n=1 Tax=Actinomadura craniellae TaxID=2231787 RepID=A0A365GXW3_9ACTN|nr:dihydrofolate reductase family protein [Actinomadura craniellae]RAY11669.1 deaminase [Actinomadura craniellae]
MRRLLPEPAADIDPYAAYGDVTGPWLRVGMVMSADGSATDAEGWTDGLGGAADFRVFRTLRALADAILVGAETVRTGRLGPARLRPDLRVRRGRPPAPIVVVSRSLDLDWSLPLFTAAETPTLVVTSAAGAARAPAGIPLVVAGEDAIDFGAAVRALRDRGLAHLLCEGGPALTASLLAAGLVDELCLNLAPTLVGDPGGPRLLGAASPAELELTALYTDEQVLFLRYRPRT